MLVTIRDDKPVLKILDFGVAKAMARKLTDQTMHTQLGVMIGTPAYMSPEQWASLLRKTADDSGADRMVVRAKAIRNKE